MHRSAVVFVAMAVASVWSPLAARAVDGDDLVPGGFAMIKEQSGLRVTSRPGNGMLDLPDSDPREEGAVLEILDTGGGAGSDVYQLPAGGWRKLPRGRGNRVSGYTYHGTGDAADPCTLVTVLPHGLRAHCSGPAVTLDPPFAGEVGVILTIGAKRYCLSFGGSTYRNDERRTHRMDAAAPDACAAPGGGTTTSTLGGGTTSTTLPGGGTTSTTIGGGTTSTTLPGGETTTTTIGGGTTSTTLPGGETTTTTIGGGTTSTTLLGETTTTTIGGGTTSTTIGGGGGCCNGAGFVSVVTKDEPGDCGDIIDVNGMVVAPIACSGLYSGGGGNSVPLPFTVPDLGTAVSALTSCTGQTANLGGTTSAETGSNRNCTSTGCLFGAPLAVPNPGSTPTSVCVLNAASAPVSGTLTCDTGATTVELPLTSVIYLTGDTSHDPASTINGIQPCPLCSGGTCIGGPNNGMSCVNGTTSLGGDPGYPTSHDCPPDPMFSIGSLPIAFTLTSGSVTWTGTLATNDSDSTASPVQTRVFSGFCRDGDGTGAFSGTTPATAQKCWENGMAVGAACNGDFESCVQRTNGAFGPSGGNNRTIVAIGTGTSLLGGPAEGKLVSVFTIPPTFDSTVDAAGDLPGPGAVALPGTATLCTTPNPCP